MTDERQHTNPPTCTCQYLTVGNRLTTHNAVDSSRCEVHGPLSALRPPTPSAPSPSLRRFLIDLRGYDVTTSDGDVAADVARLDELLVQVRSDPSSPRQAMADAPGTVPIATYNGLQRALEEANEMVCRFHMPYGWPDFQTRWGLRTATEVLATPHPLPQEKKR